jgi:hypothetical protein
MLGKIARQPLKPGERSTFLDIKWPSLENVSLFEPSTCPPPLVGSRGDILGQHIFLTFCGINGTLIATIDILPGNRSIQGRSLVSVSARPPVKAFGFSQANK